MVRLLVPVCRDVAVTIHLRICSSAKPERPLRIASTCLANTIPLLQLSWQPVVVLQAARNCLSPFTLFSL